MLTLFDACALTKLLISSFFNAADINKKRRVWLVKHSTDLGLDKIQGGILPKLKRNLGNEIMQ
jgi:hypothetical protein